MNQTMSKQVRILAIAPTARGFGYCVMEDEAILECGYKGVRGNKNRTAVSKIEKLMRQFLPDVVVLQDVNVKESRRAPRIKALHRKIVRLAANHNCKVKLFSGMQLRDALLDDSKGTKHEMAAMLAQRFPAELALKMPRKRRAWENEDGRMDMFDAVELAVVFWMKSKMLVN
jgi:Holliday junction resolvasome RuvABC endonuclease subunit